MEFMKLSSLMIWRIWGPLKIPALSFSILNPGKNLQIYLKHSPSLSRALTNCFISPSLMWSGGKIIFPLSTSGSLMIFDAPTVIFSLAGHTTFFQWSSLAQLSHKHMKQGYFVYPLCCQSKMLTIFKSTHIDPVSYTHLRAHETPEHLVCRLLLEKKKLKID